MSTNINNLYLFDDYILNPKDRTLWYGNDRVQLPAKAFDTLKLLVERGGEVLSKEEMIDLIWEGAFVEENNLSQKISILRRIFGTEKEFIETIPKIGFRFIEPVRISQIAPAPTAHAVSGHRHVQDVVAIQSETVVAPKSFVGNIARPRSVIFLFSLLLIVIMVTGSAAYFNLISFGATSRSIPTASFDYTELSDTGDIGSSAISQDGRFVVFTKLGGNSRLEKTSLRLLDTTSKNDVEIEIDGDVQPDLVKFAPDGRSIYFRTRGNLNQYEKIYRISTFGGEPTLIAEDIWGKFSISPDGKELAYVEREISGDRRKIIIQNIESGKKNVVVDSLYDPAIKPYHAPAFSPDQKSLAFSPVVRVNGKATIIVIEIGSKRTQTISTPLYTINGIVWMPAGDEFYITGLELGKRFQIWNVSYPNGELSRVTSDADSYFNLSVSKDGTIAANRVNMHSNVWIVPEAKLENAIQLTRGEAELGGLLTAQFLPNGNIIYNARFSGGSNIRLMSSNGENSRLFVNKQLRTEHNFSFSKRRELIFFEYEDRIWKANFDGSGAERVELGEALQMSSPAVSHDEEWLYFVKRERDHDAIWKTTLDSGEAELVYVAENFSPETFLSVSPDGKYLAFEYHEKGKIGSSGENSRGLRNFGLLNLSTNEIKVIEVRASRSIFRWSNGGKTFDYMNFTENGSAIYRRHIEEGAEPTKIFELKNELIYRFDWSHDGKDLLLGRGNEKINLITLRLRDADL